MSYPINKTFTPFNTVNATGSLNSTPVNVQAYTQFATHVVWQGAVTGTLIREGTIRDAVNAGPGADAVGRFSSQSWSPINTLAIAGVAGAESQSVFPTITASPFTWIRDRFVGAGATSGSLTTFLSAKA